MPFRFDRVDESRMMVWESFLQAFGSYVEQEGKRADEWRDKDIWTLYRHLEHELQEVRGNLKRGELGFLLHNLYDVMELAAIMCAKIREELQLRSAAEETRCKIARQEIKKEIDSEIKKIEEKKIKNLCDDAFLGSDKSIFAAAPPLYVIWSLGGSIGLSTSTTRE